MTAIVMRTGRRDVMISARWLEVTAPAAVRLHSAEAYARSVQRRSGDVVLAADVLLAEGILDEGLLLFSRAEAGRRLGAHVQAGISESNTLRRGALLLCVYGIHGGGVAIRF